MKRASCIVLLNMIFLLCSGLFAGATEANPVTITDEHGNSKEVYKVSDGFYQDSATYSTSNNFYITDNNTTGDAKNGLEYFQKLVSASDNGEVVLHYYQNFVGNSASTAERTPPVTSPAAKRPSTGFPSLFRTRASESIFNPPIV